MYFKKMFKISVFLLGWSFLLFKCSSPPPEIPEVLSPPVSPPTTDERGRFCAKVYPEVSQQPIYQACLSVKWRDKVQGIIQKLHSQLKEKNSQEASEVIDAWTEDALKTLQTIDTEFRSAVNKKEVNDPKKEEWILLFIKEIEEYFSEEATKTAGSFFKAPLEQAAVELYSTVDSSLKLDDSSPSFPKVEDEASSSRYQEEVEDPTRDILRDRYDRRTLGLLNDKELNAPLEEELYQFQSPEGEFVDKAQKLYEDLSELNPWHEQGFLSRKASLQVLQKADRALLEEQKAEAEVLYQAAKVLKVIVEGALPSGGERNVYAVLTGKDLITGLDRSDLTQDISLAGSFLSQSSMEFSEDVAVRVLQQTKEEEQKN